MVVGCQPLTGESMRWIKDTVSGLSGPHDAAARNRVAKMQKYVMQGGDVNKRNKLGDTPLHEACAYIRDNGDTSKGKKRKMVGKDRRKVGKKLSSRALGEGGPLDMLELLIHAGAHVNAQNIVGDAPLHKAALNGRALSADRLLRAGADVNIRNEFFQTPLHSACMSGNIEVVQRLVRGGADTNAQDAAADTPFHEACRHQYEAIVIYLMGLVNKPTTSQGLELWEGLDPGWEKVLRSRAQARVEGAEERGGNASAVGPSSQSPAGVPLSTPSTAHCSIQSMGSARGMGSARTPSALQFSNRTSLVVQSSHTESMSPLRVPVSSSHQTKMKRPTAESEAIPMTPPVCITPRLPGGAGASARVRGNRRGREKRSNEEGQKVPADYSTGPAEVLAWQATKVKSAQQGMVLEKAREALREEQEAAMAMSSTTAGDDEGSVDTPIAVEDGKASHADGAARQLIHAASINGNSSVTSSTARPNGISSWQGKGAGGHATSRAGAAAAEVGSNGYRKSTTTSTEYSLVGSASHQGKQGRAHDRGLVDSESSGRARDRPVGSATPLPQTPTTPTRRSASRDMRLLTPSRDGRRRAVRKGKAVALASPRAREPGSHRGSASGRSSSRRVSSRPESDRRYVPPNGASVGRTSSRPPSGADGFRLDGTAEATTASRPHLPSSRSRQGSTNSPANSEQSARSRKALLNHEQPLVPTGSGPRAVSQPSFGAGSVASRSQRSASNNNASGPSPAARRQDGRYREDEPRQHRRSERDATSASTGVRSSPSRSSRRSRQSSISSPEAALAGSAAPEGSQGAEHRRDVGGSGSSKRRSGDSSMRRSSSSRDHRFDVNVEGQGDRRQRSEGLDRRRSSRSSHESRPATAPVSVPSHADEAVKVPSSLSSVERSDSLSQKQAQVSKSLVRKTSSSRSIGREDSLSRAFEAAHVEKANGIMSSKTMQERAQKEVSGRTVMMPLASDEKAVLASGEGKVLTPKATARPKKKSVEDSDIAVAVATESPSTARKQTERQSAGIPKRRAQDSPRPSRTWDVPDVLDAPTMLPTRRTKVLESKLPVKRLSPLRNGAQGNGRLVPAPKPEPVGADASGGDVGGCVGKPEGSSRSFQSAAGTREQEKLKVSVTNWLPPSGNNIPRSVSYDTHAGALNAGTDKQRNGSQPRGASTSSRPSSRDGATAHLANADALSACSTEDDLPPDIDALRMNGNRKTDIVSYQSFEGPARVVVQVQTVTPSAAVATVPSEEKASAAPVDKSRHTSWFVAAKQTSSKAVAMALGASKALLFSDSDSETVEESTSGTRQVPGALTFGASDGLATMFSDATAHSNASDSDSWDKGIEDTLEAAADGAASSYIRKRSSGEILTGNAKKPSTSGNSRNDAVLKEETVVVPEGPAPTEESMPAARKPSKAPVEPANSAPTEESMPSTKSSSSEVLIVPPRSTTVFLPSSVSPSTAPRALPSTASAGAGGKKDEVAAPGNSGNGLVLDAESTASEAKSPLKSAGVVPSAAFFAAGRGNLGPARARSTLGRPGKGPVKVTMPIVGGRAAWNKFLASADGAAPSAPTASEGASSMANGGHEAALAALSPGADESDDEEQHRSGSVGNSDAASESVAPANLESRGPPRGFKAPVATEGPNKGPAGAFSGNAMWRLAGGATSSAARAQEGVAANGHGGYSNPLAAMRANGGAGTTGGATGAAMGAGGAVVANPLAGLRGTGAMGGAGRVNSLARGGVRGLGAGAVANPLLGGSNQNPLARKRMSTGDTPPRGGSTLGDRAMRRTNTAVGLLSHGKSDGAASYQGSTRNNDENDIPSAPAVQSQQPEPSIGTAGSREAIESPDNHLVEFHGDAKRRADGLSDGAGEWGQKMDNGFIVIGGLRNGGLNGSLPPPPPRRYTRASQRGESGAGADRDPGQTKVASVVMAMQNHTSEARQGLVIQDPHQHVEVSSVAEQGLVRLRRVKYSPRPAR